MTEDLRRGIAGVHALVTGAAAGIGRATARLLSQRGAIVSALDRDAAGLDTLTAEGIFPLVADVTDPEALERAHGEAVARAGAVGILINNAGVDDRRHALDIDAEQWRRALSVNLDHHFLLARLVAPGMRNAGGGAIVNLSSSAWMKLAPNLAAYHASKAGIVGLTRGLARDLGPMRIRVNAVAPGRVAIERTAAMTADPAWQAETRALQCLPDIITPDDIARTLLWLASDEARMVTGQTIVVDGGVV